MNSDEGQVLRDARGLLNVKTFERRVCSCGMKNGNRKQGIRSRLSVRV